MLTNDPVRLAAGPLLLLGSLTLAGASPRAQTPCSEVDFEGGNLVCIPEGGSGSFGEMVFGDLNGNRIPEVAVLRGTHLYIAHDPAIGNDSVEVASDALAVCYVPADATGTASMLYSTSTGMKRVVFAAPMGAYVSDPESNAGGWAGARELHLDAQGKVFGVASDGKTVLRSTVTGGDVDPPQALFVLGPSIRDMRLMDWNGDGQTEIALLHSNGIHIRTQSGSFLVARPAAFPWDPFEAVAVDRRPEGDVLAWTTRLADEQSYLLLFGANYTSSLYRGPYQLDTESTATSIGDLDGEGFGDLALVRPDSSDVHVITELKAVESLEPPQLLTSQVHALGLPDEPGTSGGFVLCTDLFLDWNDQTQAPLAALALVLPDGPAGPALRLLPSPIGKDEPCSYCVFSSGDFGPAQYGDQDCEDRTWSLVVNENWGAIAATNLEVTVRRVQGEATNPDPGAYFHGFSPMPTTATTVTFTGTEQTDDAYFVVVRPVRRQGTTVVQAWRSTILSMTSDCGRWEWLKDLSGAFTSHALFIDFQECLSGCPPPGSALGRYLPTAVPQSRLPSSGAILPGNPPN